MVLRSLGVKFAEKIQELQLGDNDILISYVPARLTLPLPF